MSEKTNQSVIAKYEGAEAIYLLQRSKKLNAFQRAVDVAVGMFTPLPGLFDTEDALANSGRHYLVSKDGEEILLYVDGSGIQEEVVTGKLQKKEKEFLYKGFRYAPTQELLTGKRSFHMLL